MLDEILIFINFNDLNMLFIYFSIIFYFFDASKS